MTERQLPEIIMRNATLFTADRTTHLKIVVVALAASVAVSLIGISIRVMPTNTGTQLRTASQSIMAGG